MYMYMYNVCARFRVILSMDDLCQRCNEHAKKGKIGRIAYVRVPSVRASECLCVWCYPLATERDHDTYMHAYHLTWVSLSVYVDGREKNERDVDEWWMLGSDRSMARKGRKEGGKRSVATRCCRYSKSRYDPLLRPLVA